MIEMELNWILKIYKITHTFILLCIFTFLIVKLKSIFFPDLLLYHLSLIVCAILEIQAFQLWALHLLNIPNVINKAIFIIYSFKPMIYKLSMRENKY